MDKDQLAVALAINDNYTKMAMVVLESLFSSCQEDTHYECYILHYGLSIHNRNILKEYMKEHRQHRLLFLEISEEDYDTLNCFPSEHIYVWSLEMFFRLYLPKYLPHHDRVLYLDADTIVRSDLKHLSRIDLTDKAIAGTQEIAYIAQYTTLMRGMYRLTLLLKGEVSEADRHHILQWQQINSGVLLMNLDFWRRHQLCERAFAILGEIQHHTNDLLFAPDILYNYNYVPKDRLLPDQDIINYLAIIEFPNSICHLPTAYNVRVLYNPQDHLAKDSFGDGDLDLNQLMWKGVADSLVTCDGVVFDDMQIIHLAGVRPWTAEDYQHPIRAFYEAYAQKVGLVMAHPAGQGLFFDVVSYRKILRSPKKILKMILPYGVVRVWQKIRYSY